MVKTGDFYKALRDKFSLTALLGETGFDRPVRWLYMAEDKNNFDFIRGGELAVTTGMSIGGRDGLFDFVSAVIKKNASGLIVNTGRYILSEDITEDIKSLCMKNNFMLLEMPWEIHISDLMQTFADMHFKDQQKTEELSLAFDAFCSGTGDSSHKKILEKYGFNEGDSYCAAISDCNWEEAVYSNDHVFVKEKRIIFHNMTYDEIEKALEGRKCHTGAGSEGAGYESLYKSSVRAAKALKIAKYKDCNLFAYEKAGTYALFMEIEDRKCIESFGISLLGRVYDYDKKHGSDMVKTLMAYIKFRGSVKAAAESMSCHRNTVTYRMERIKEMLERDLENGEYLAELMAAGAALEYAEVMKNEL